MNTRSVNMQRTCNDGCKGLQGAGQAPARFSARQQHRKANQGRRQICRAAATVTKGAPVKQAAGFTVQGTSRKRNEDRYALQAGSWGCYRGVMLESSLSVGVACSSARNKSMLAYR